MAENNFSAKVVRLGIPDKWIEHGEQAQLYEECGFSPAQIAQAAVDILKEKKETTIKRA